MFKRLFGRKQKAEPAQPTREKSGDSDQPQTEIAYVMLADTHMARGDVVTRSILQRLPEMTVESTADEPLKALAFNGPGAFGMIGFLDYPNPIGPEDSCVKSAWWWLQAAEAIEARKAHVIVALSGVENPKRRSILLAKLTAAVLDCTPSAIGVIWNDADAVWPAEMFRVSVDEAGDALALPILISVKIGGDTEFPCADGSAAWLGMTYGLKAFGLMEIETRGWDGAPQEMVDHLLNIASYLVDQGAVIKDGDTLGPDAGAKFQIRHLASTLAPGTTVYRLHRMNVH